MDILDDKNLSGYFISNKLNIPQSTISNLRSGKRVLDNLTLDTIEKLCSLKNVSIKPVIQNVLLDDNITGYRLSKELKMPQSSISAIRNGKRNIDNLTLETVEKIYKYAEIKDRKS